MGPEALLTEHIIGTTPDREGIAIRCGWEVLHLRAARTRKGWVVPVTGSLGKGWPDLILVRPPRIIAAELKAGRGKPTIEQLAVLGVLRQAGVEVYIWRPEDWPAIVQTLR